MTMADSAGPSDSGTSHCGDHSESASMESPGTPCGQAGLEPNDDDYTSLFPSYSDKMDVTDKLERQRVLSARRKRAHRQRIKQELLDLQTEEAALRLQLENMQRMALLRPPSEQTERMKKWKELAIHQRHARDDAEAVNRELRAKINASRVLASDLSQLISSRLDGTSLRPQPQSHTGVDVDAADMSLLIMFVGEMDDVYAQTDTMMRRAGFPKVPEDLWDHRIDRRWNADDGTVDFHISDAFVIPFDYTQARFALWKSMRNLYAKEDNAAQFDTESRSDIIAVNYRKFSCPEEQIWLVATFVMRQYVETTRTVIVWRAFTEGDGPTIGLSTDEIGCCVVRPVTGINDMDGEMTVIETYSRMTPLCESNSQAAMELECFVDQVIESVCDDGEEISRLMDGLILNGHSSQAALSERDR